MSLNVKEQTVKEPINRLNTLKTKSHHNEWLLGLQAIKNPPKRVKRVLS
jgi:hypothetical protein